MIGQLVLLNLIRKRTVAAPHEVSKLVQGVRNLMQPAGMIPRDFCCMYEYVSYEMSLDLGKIGDQQQQKK